MKFLRYDACNPIAATQWACDSATYGGWYPKETMTDKGSSHRVSVPESTQLTMSERIMPMKDLAIIPEIFSILE